MDLARVGRAVRALRRRRGWSQRALGAAADISGPTIGRIERGGAGGTSLAVLDRVVRELGGVLEVGVRWNGAELDRLIDSGHARLVEAVVALLRGYGWTVAVEVTFSVFGERGSIDVVGTHPSGALVIVEVKATMSEANSTLSVLDRKARLAPRIARERGWRAVPLGTILVVEDGRTNRRRLALHEATFRAALPAGTREVRAWLRDPRGPMRGVMFLSSARQVSASRPPARADEG